MTRKNRIEELLQHHLTPIYLQVEDESANHHVPQGAETHFKITLVSEEFANLPRISRHRMLNHLLNAEFNLGLHALSMHLYTLEEWEKKNKTVLQSPACRDGYNND